MSIHKKISIFSVALAIVAATAGGAVIKVPQDIESLKEAVAKAEAGDTVLVAPGTYEIDDELIVDKAITVASEFIDNKDESVIEATVIKATENARKQWFDILKSATGAKVIGLTLEGNKKHTLGIHNPDTEISYCRFIAGSDQLSFEGGGGLVSHCYFEGGRDDAIDADNSVSWIIENCTITTCRDDGIEIRLHRKGAPLTRHIVRNNTFVDCRRTGVQLIDYDGDSFREFEIYGNTFRNIGNTAIDCTVHTANQNVDGSPMVERAIIYNNTITDAKNGITMGPNVLILNNIFSGLTGVGIIKGIFQEEGTQSFADNNMFFDVAKAYDDGVKAGESMMVSDKQLVGDDFGPLPGGGAVEAGASSYTWADGSEFNVPAELIKGKAPNIGAR